MSKKSARRPDARRPAAGRHEYPRPQLVRNNWASLDGTWQFALDPDEKWHTPNEVRFNKEIVVPYAPETPMSGVGDTGFYRACWYRRTFTAPKLDANSRLMLHFGAVDYSATVWVNDQLAVRHEGGYTPFSADITDHLTGRGPQSIVVRAHDDPQDLAKPRGKQDWQLEPHSIWYPRTTGIWQSVWMEQVPATYIRKLKFTPSLERWEIAIGARLAGAPRDDLRLRVRMSSNGKLISDDVYNVIRDEVSRRVAFSDPGIDDYRNELLWFPWRPNLIDAEVELIDAKGKILDRVQSYTAMRSVAVQGDRFVLNNRPFYLRLVLDQGYWAESGLTAPDDAAIRRDVELVKELGFNGVRKHQKSENPRFLYWADRLGLLVWNEMPSPYRFTPEAVERLTKEWLDIVDRDCSHPSVIAWVPFNESWGVPDLPDDPMQRHYLRSIYHLTKTLDSTRPVIGNDGWEMVVTDIIAIHDYEHSPQRMIERYRDTADNLDRLFRRERPGHRQLLLDDLKHHDQCIMLTEFGGIAYHKDTKGTWGYRRAGTEEDFKRQYSELLQAVRSLPLFAGFCYTQFTDTYQEANGLLYMDRTPKFPIEEIRRATEG